jgi:hypothetical protein
MLRKCWWHEACKLLCSWLSLLATLARRPTAAAAARQRAARWPAHARPPPAASRTAPRASPRVLGRGGVGGPHEQTALLLAAPAGRTRTPPRLRRGHSAAHCTLARTRSAAAAPPRT